MVVVGGGRSQRVGVTTRYCLAWQGPSHLCTNFHYQEQYTMARSVIDAIRYVHTTITHSPLTNQDNPQCQRCRPPPKHRPIVTTTPSSTSTSCQRPRQRSGKPTVAMGHGVINRNTVRYVHTTTPASSNGDNGCLQHWLLRMVTWPQAPAISDHANDVVNQQ